MPTLTNLETGIIQRALDDNERRIARDLLRNLREARRDIEREVSALYKKWERQGALSRAELAKYGRLTALQSDLEEALSPHLRKNRKVITDFRLGQYRDSYYQELWAIEQDIQVNLSFAFYDTDAVKAALETPIYGEELSDLLKRQDRRTVLQLRNIVSQGIGRGLSYGAIARQIDQLTGPSGSPFSRAMRDARTEGHRAAQMARIAAYNRAESLGVRLSYYWSATLDERTRISHGNLDGQKANSDGLFQTPVGLIEGPGLSGDYGFDSRCTCNKVARVDDLAPKLRRVRDQGVVPYVTYNTWARKRGII